MPNGIFNTMKDILRVVAPTAAQLLGGPLAGNIVRGLSDVLLGKPDGTAEEVTDALQKADYETLLKVKDLDATFKVQMKQLDIDLERLANEDRASARHRQIETRDMLPGVIALAVLVGFFGLLGLIAFHPLPSTADAPLNVMLGALAGMVTAVAQFYFGSSASSRAKDATISTIIKNGTP